MIYMKFKLSRGHSFPLESGYNNQYNVVDMQCKAKCPYHCKSWMIIIGGYNLSNGQPMGEGLQEDRTLSFLIGKLITNLGSGIKDSQITDTSNYDKNNIH